ncbi:MAG: peroxiredoxin-like family protein [Phycisphaerae bacterium]
MRWLFLSSLFVLVAVGCDGKKQTTVSEPTSEPVQLREGIALRAQAVDPIGVGEKVPDATVRTPDGKRVSLRSQVSQQPSVIVFHRGGWCIYCNRHLAALQEIEEDLRRLGCQLLAISPDRPAELRKTQTKQRTKFPLYSDSDLDAISAFRPGFVVDRKTRDAYRGYGIDLQSASGEDHHVVPVPGRATDESLLDACQRLQIVENRGNLLNWRRRSSRSVRGAPICNFCQILSSSRLTCPGVLLIF